MQQVKMQFAQLCTQAFATLQAGENLNISLSGEQHLYVRFNNSLVRQTTHVEQYDCDLVLQSAGRQTSWGITLSMNPAHTNADKQILQQTLARMREEISALPVDPHLVPLANGGQSEQIFTGHLPSETELIELIANQTQNTDFTGLYAGGTSFRAATNNLGQQHWFSNQTFFLDYSLYTRNIQGENKAAKAIYAGANWQTSDFLANFKTTKAQLVPLQDANKILPPGKYRAYLAPSAAAEIFAVLG